MLTFLKILGIICLVVGAQLVWAWLRNKRR